MFDDDVKKVMDNIGKDGFFFDDFEDMDFDNESSVGNYEIVELATNENDYAIILLEEIKEVMVEALKESVEMQKINYIVDVLESNAGLIKQEEQVENPKEK